MSIAEAAPLLQTQINEPPPSTEQAAAASTSSRNAFPSTKKHLPFQPKPTPFLFLSLSLPLPPQSRRNSAVTPPNSGRLLQPLNKPSSQNPQNPPFPLKIFEGLTSLFSRFIFNNTLFSSDIFCPPAIAKENNSQKSWDFHDWPANLVIGVNNLNGFKKYKISAVQFLYLHSRSVKDDADETFGDMVGLRPGGIYTKQDLIDRLDFLSSSGYFEKIEMDVKTNPDGTITVNIPVKEMKFPRKSKFRCISVGLLPAEKPTEPHPDMTHNEKIEYERMIYAEYQKKIKKARGCILPRDVENEIDEMLRQSLGLTSGMLTKIARKIQNWYRENEYDAASVVGFSPTVFRGGGGEIYYEVAEGDITELKIRFRDKLGNFCEGNTNVGIIKRALPKEVAVGNVFKRRAFEEAKHNIMSLDLFSYVEIIPNQDEKNGRISAEIILQEHPNTSAEVNTAFNIVPGRNRLPTLDSLQPSTTISYERRNIKGLNRSFHGALTISNLFDPEDDIGFNFEYKHPYIDGLENRRNRTFQATCFNTRKLSPVFTAESGGDETALWVDRAGIKATITEDYSKQSKFTYGLVMEDTRTRDAAGNIVARGHKVSFDGQVQSTKNGPPTTLSGNGVDQMAFLQANLTRDNTRFVNGAIVGQRDIFQVDQGIGIGSKFAFFNRHKISATRFIPLKKVEQGKGKSPPPVLALHGVYGGCVGDLPNHEAFTIGGPHSVRGYSIGEIGASRYKIEVAAEVRVPVKSTYVYAFAEHGNDLGSSVALKGNPTKSYKRKGHGTSYGAGIKLGQLRAEYAVDHNARKGAFFFHFGDRF